MPLFVIISILYIFLVVFVCLKILYGVHSTTKTFAYLLVTLFIPVVGMLVYFAVGANYRKNKLYSKKIIRDDRILAEIGEKIISESESNWRRAEQEVQSNEKLARLLLNDNSPLTGNNKVKLLLNGENKFPVVISALKGAKHHIHLEYYIFEDDDIGNEIKKILIQKAADLEGRTMTGGASKSLADAISVWRAAATLYACKLAKTVRRS